MSDNAVEQSLTVRLSVRLQSAGGGRDRGADGSEPVAPRGTRGVKRLHHALPDAAGCNTSLLLDAAGYTPIAPPDNATHARCFCRILAPGLNRTYN